MGDLAVGARSGSGENEGEGGESGTESRTPEASPSASASVSVSGSEAQTAARGAPPTAERGSDISVSTGAEDGTTSDHTSGGQGRPQRSFLKELPILIGIALILALLIKTFLVQAFSIPSNSMQNTLQVGDRVLVDKLTPWFGSEPERGEIVVFEDPGGWLNESPVPEPSGVGGAVQTVLSSIGLMPSASDQDLIKRVVAIGGDRVECKRGGPVQVNGKALDESYLFPGNTSCDDKPFGPVEVPVGKMWVMGDHRQDSLDSRYHQKLDNGMIPTDKVVGRAIVVAWPVTRWSALPVPDTFDQKGLEAKAAAAAPAAAGVAGAVPLVLWLRRRRTVRANGRPFAGD
ncbi:signal peptidase [Streptomyces abyssalis]|uniref:Signal peptidase I n=1 Tax=Streptomyces abyssalis TaxID=933944 RepID=A0A1E7JHG3_9ACTN|nr:signal peptidase I [Streptomyces abyssalis]OEU85887.1 signal peptidase [Streptomyces abyssalis]OEU92647.1 signal peptidase [Streptomyces abyssalis]